MFLFLPIGLDDMKVGRWPVVSIGIAVSCLLIFLGTQAELTAPMLHTWGLVPAEGVLQIGWISSMFLHADWTHLLGNLLFLYIAAPYVEDAWGVGRFVILYVLGGIVAGIGQLALDPSSTIPVIGASGAVAACMGAFSVQFPRRKVRVFWFFLRLTGTFFVPVWLWGSFWFAKELFFLTIHGVGSGVAFGAHLGGFAFGAVMALAIIKLQGDPFVARYGANVARPPIVAPPLPDIASTTAAPARPQATQGRHVPPGPAVYRVDEPPPPVVDPLDPPRPFPTRPRLPGEP